MSNRSHLESLPSELLYMTCAYLSDPALFSLLCTSRHLYHHALPTLQNSARKDRANLLVYSIAHDNPSLLQLLLYDTTQTATITSAVSTVLGAQYSNITGPTTKKPEQIRTGRTRHPHPKQCSRCGSHTLTSLSAVLPLITMSGNIVRRSLQMGHNRGTLMEWLQLLVPYIQASSTLFRSAFRALVSAPVSRSWSHEAFMLLLKSLPAKFSDRKRSEITALAYKHAGEHLNTGPQPPPYLVLLEDGYPQPTNTTTINSFWAHLVQPESRNHLVQPESRNHLVLRHLLQLDVPVYRPTLEMVAIDIPWMLPEFISRYEDPWDLPLLKTVLARHVAGLGFRQCFDLAETWTLETDTVIAAAEALESKFPHDKAVVRDMFRDVWNSCVNGESDDTPNPLFWEDMHKFTCVDLTGCNKVKMKWCKCRGGRMRSIARWLGWDEEMQEQWKKVEFADFLAPLMSSHEEMQRAAAAMVWGGGGEEELDRCWKTLDGVDEPPGASAGAVCPVSGNFDDGYELYN